MNFVLFLLDMKWFGFEDVLRELVGLPFIVLLFVLSSAAGASKVTRGLVIISVCLAWTVAYLLVVFVFAREPARSRPNIKRQMMAIAVACLTFLVFGAGN